MTKEEFLKIYKKEERKEAFLNLCKEYQKKYKSMRWGQSVFNVADDFGIARKLQFEYHIDCFYNDSKVEEFVNIFLEELEND